MALARYRHSHSRFGPYLRCVERDWAACSAIEHQRGIGHRDAINTETQLLGSPCAHFLLCCRMLLPFPLSAAVVSRFALLGRIEVLSNKCPWLRIRG
jgi:hypothetical protein